MLVEEITNDLFCLLAYILYTEMQDMDKTFRHLQLRLHLEQSRLLHWGKRAGVMEELLQEPSRRLHLNRNLIQDVLQEIKPVFEQTLRITEKNKDILLVGTSGLRELENGDRDLLRRALGKLQSLQRLQKRLEWASVGKDKFEQAVGKLIGDNDTLEGLLSANNLDTLIRGQNEMYLKVVQLHKKMGRGSTRRRIAKMGSRQD
ncbi:prion-inhibition and propagation, helo domain-containing protein [Aspergillus californicus]